MALFTARTEGEARRARSIRMETPRLVIRRFRESDLAEFMAYRNDPEVARYQSWESITRGEAEEFIALQSRLNPGTPGKWFQFAAELKGSGALAGDCALLVHKAAPKTCEIGYSFARAFQGIGLASEAVRAVIGFAFESLAMNRVLATTDCRNQPSFKLMERVGMKRTAHYLKNAWFKGAWCDEYQYAMLRREWMRLRDRPPRP